MNDAEDVRFTTNVLLKSIIGKDLINNDNIAILELVKNAYDAGTPEVLVTFRNLKDNDDSNGLNTYSAKSTKIIIQDFGHGMDREDLINKWLNIAYSEKKLNRISNNRLLAGAKGVGRFSCDRLGQFLDLYTRKENGTIYHLKINWKDFEIDNAQDLTIQQIPLSLNIIIENEFEKKTGYKLLSSGTILEVSKLRSQWAYYYENKRNSWWDTDKILKLKEYLSKLVNPNKAFEGNSFKIFLNVPDFQLEDLDREDYRKLNGEVDNKIFEELFFKATSIEGEISSDGKVITTKLNDKGRLIFEIEEENIHFPLLKGIKINLMFLNPYAKAYFTKQTGTRSVSFGSVFLFINGFRISPLGDEGNDWLGLELRKGQGFARSLGTRDLIGRIEIHDPKNTYQIISSREGLVKDDKYDQLIKPTAPYDGFFYKELKRLEKYVVDGLMWDRVPDPNIFFELEKKIKEANWQYNPADEVYEHSQELKNTSVLQSLSSIMAVNPNEVKRIYINEDLIGQMLEESEGMAFEQVRNVVKQLSRFDARTVDEATKSMLEHLDKIIAEKDEKLRLKQLEIERAQEEAKNAQEEKTKLRQELGKVEKKVEEYRVETSLLKINQERLQLENRNKETQIAYFKSSQTLDLDRVINLHHHIKIHSHTIDNSIAFLSSSIEDGSFALEDLKEALTSISFANQKIMTITKFATKANFLIESQKINEDLIGYITQYIKEVYLEIVGSKMEIELNNKNGIQFVKEFTPIELSMVIDNLLDNSLKATASKVIIDFENEGNKLFISYKDDGEGLNSTIPEGGEGIIFEKGFTTTFGSGLGLHHVAQIIYDLGGDIKVKRRNPGVEFNFFISN